MSSATLSVFKMADNQAQPKQVRTATWSKDDLHCALEQLRNGIGINKVSRTYKIPKPTLKRHIDCKNKYANEEDTMRGRATTLPLSVEKDLVSHIMKLEGMLFGLTRKDIRSLAFQIVESNNISHNFSRKKRMAGKDWFNAFISRHNLSLRQPESTSIARAYGFNKSAVTEFFNKLEQVIRDYNLDGMRVFNADETGLSTVQKTQQKVVTMKGRRRIGKLTSGERGVNTTALFSVSASGNQIPPMLLFKRKRMKDELKEGAPEGTLFSCNESGWMDMINFEKWMKHFIACVKPSKARPVLLILDGHATHTKNLNAINLAHDSGVIMLNLPPHTTHRLQPLDVSFFKPLQTYYAQETDRWLRNHPGRCLNTFQVSYLLGQAYPRASNMSNIINGFQKSGIWPCNRHVFADSDFVSSRAPFIDPEPCLPTPQMSIAQQEPTPETFQLAPTPEACQQAPTPEARQQAPTPETRQQAPTPETHEQAPTPETCQQAPIPETCQQAPTPETHQQAPTPETCQQAPTHEACQQAPSPHMPTLICRQSLSTSTKSRSATTLSASSSRTIKVDGKDYNVIVTEPDGRCFFRSVTISTHSELQSTKRTAFGVVENRHLNLKEKLKADLLRSQVTDYMLQHIENFDHEKGILCGDMPSYKQYEDIYSRIDDMSMQNTMSGELEIIATSQLLKRQLCIINSSSTTNDGHFAELKYGEQEFPSSTPIYLIFNSVGDDVGHYDCLVSAQQNVDHHYIPVENINALPMRVKIQNQKKRKTETCEILTSSPYKKRLALSKCINPKSKRKCNKADYRNRSESSQENGSHKQSMWYCFMCDEDFEEDMIKCQICAKWVHFACAGSGSMKMDRYVCELCE